ncbi:Lar family restriction alleviation protein [Providencia rettgeri]|uniref:Lar family restriction alleviation protein n=1 Tax=Providencia rettgeri TaxID=587 RepID=UPI001B3801EE
MMNELKKCPFCGGEAKLVGYFLMEAKCRKCRASLPPKEMEEAIYAWNRRANSE